MVPQQQRRRRRRAALPRAGERRVVVARGVGGFGFTIAGQRPCVVSAVAAGGPAERAGLRAGDALLSVDGASVARAPHASVARLVAGAPGAIALSVAPRDAPPTDTEDTEPDERVRTRRRHPPPRHHRRPHPLTHHPGCQAVPSTSAVSELLQRLTQAQLSPSHAARLECRAVVGYLGTIETPQAETAGAPGNVRIAVRKLRQERRSATPVLLSVLPASLLLRRPAGQPLAQYGRDRIVYAGCPSDADRRYFGLVTAADAPDAAPAHCTHVFAVDPRAAAHEAHTARARDFHITCTRDPVAERCLEFPPSAEYVVGVIRGMYSLPPDEGSSPALMQISKLALKGDSPAGGNFSRCNRALLAARNWPARHEEVPGFVANSPQPSNHSEITTTSSNSDSGIGFHNDGRNIADRIVVVEFAGQQPALNRFRQEMPRRPVGLVGCSSFDADGSFLSNTTPVVDGFGGQGRPLNLDDVMLNAADLPARRLSPHVEYDAYNYNHVYGNAPSTSRGCNGSVYDQGCADTEGHYELLPAMDAELAETFHSVEIYDERGCSAESVGDSVSVYSSRSVEEPQVARRRHMQASLDDMLVLGRRDQPHTHEDDAIFLHPAAVKCKIRKSKPLNILSRTREILTGKGREKEDRRRAISASAGDVSGAGEGGDESLPAAASEPDLRDNQSEQSSPFRRWTTGSGAGSSYRHADHRLNFQIQMNDSGGGEGPSGSQWPTGGVPVWSLGIDQLLKHPTGLAAFAAFLESEYAHENLLFWHACERYSNACEEARAALSQEIWDRHLADGAPDPVNVDSAARRQTWALIQEAPKSVVTFSGAQRQIYDLMKMDLYPRFLKSNIHAAYARADLRGLPPPHSSTAPSDHPPTSSKLKKSASNASASMSALVSERRRSGGASLLPWRLRPGSRDRSTGTGAAAPAAAVPLSAGPMLLHAGGSGAATPRVPPVQHMSTKLCDSAAPATAPPSATAHTAPSAHPSGEVLPLLLSDVVKSGALCRVVLPDGATSVVGVDPNIPVRRLVDRLLTRRNLLAAAANYDVVIKDARQGEPSVIDAGAPSTVLGGREVVIERRCVVRLEVGGRCVAVRCRPARRLRHVLKPVLARYAPTSTAPAQVLKDGSPLHPDTPMQELDGTRLQIVEMSEASSECGRDEDTESLSELAVRLADAPDGAPSPAPGAADSCAGAGLVSGRVRAALRQGPPVHHHPPDFLVNLRETQRARLGGKTEPTPAPRAPPPLPPKPARPPTLI